MEDIGWQQRFENYKMAFALLEDTVSMSYERSLSKLEEQGLVQRFEFTHELAWNVIKDYLEHQGNTSITGSHDATREAFNKGLLEDVEGWMDMISSRNQSPQTYHADVTNEIIDKIINSYCALFAAFKGKMDSLAEG